MGFAMVLCASGLAAEAKIARRAGFSVVVGAGDPERTAELIEAVLPQANFLVSFGIAGALTPELLPGDVILSAEVVSEDRSWHGDERWRRRVGDLARVIGAIEGAVLGGRAILATRADKARAWTQTGAVAVDLESAVVARAAAAAGIPFVVLRTIADSAYRELPPAALIPLAPDGTPEFPRVLASVLRRPRQLAGLFALARETRIALSALERPAWALRDLAAVA